MPVIVLHAGEHDGDLLFWGETPADDRGDGSSSSTLKKKRSSSSSAARPYPFATDTDDLLRALEAVIPGYELAEQLAYYDMDVWLPTIGSEPVPSSDIIAEPPSSSRAKARIAPWRITAHHFSTKIVVDLLSASMDRHTVAPGIVVGADLAYWADVLRLAGSAVARQQFLPDIITADDDQYRAVWSPVFAGGDAEQLGKMARLMPAAGRALSRPAAVTTTAAKAAPDSPARVLDRILAVLVDYLVRMAIGRATGPDAAAPPLVGGPPVQPRARRRGRSRRRTNFDSVHDAWLYALRSDGDGDMGQKHTLASLPGLAAQVREWQQPVAIMADSPFRLCFRLEEPDEDARGAAANTWHISYLLQPHDDPSLLVSAADVWDDSSQEAAVLARSGSNVKEFLLISLGQASGICPGITDSLAAGPGLAGHTVNTEGAYRFLTDEASALEQAGYGIMLPSWWTGRGTKTRLAARAHVKPPKMQASAGLRLDTILQFDWKLALGDQQITLARLEQLAEVKVPLVRVRGMWMEVNAEQIRKAIKFFKKGTSQTTLRDVIQMALGGSEVPGGVDFDGITATGRVAQVLDQMDGDAKFEDLQPPDGLSATLRPYQVRGYSWLAFLRRWGLGGCLADDMGLGKTVQMLALVQRDWKAGADTGGKNNSAKNGRSKNVGTRPVLVVCPTSVISNWQREAARFTPGLPVMIHHGAARLQGAAFKKAARTHALVITSYGLLHRDIKFLQSVSWNGIVLDEAQNVKNSQTKQSRAARMLEADYRFAMTGTPVENNVGDMWSLMEFANPGFLGSSEEFKRNFFVPIQVEGDPDAADRLRRATGPFILRRLKTDKTIISDLPEKMDMKVFCPLTREQASLYSSVVRDIEESIYSSEGIERKGLILSLITKLKQVCNHPAQFLGDNSAIPGRSGKLARLTEMLEEVIEVGDRALVFTQFVETGNIIRRHIQETFGLEVPFLHGGVTKAGRDRMVERFQGGRDGPRIFVISLKAGGTGLNLTAANHVFHFDRWWNPAVEDQATDRVFRIGQKRNVQVHKLICSGTLEEKIDAIIERKKQIAGSVVGAGEGWLTSMSNDEIREVLSLGRQAVEA